ncbi:MAG: PH domain-containing protein [Deltaproteobacteria bacterium]|nr:PH domain-containing protein [Deltaproteobacteria bacterium]
MKQFKATIREGERILYEGTLHWIAYSGSFLWLFFGLWIINRGENFHVPGGLFVLISLVTGILTAIKIRTAFYWVTSEQVLIQCGVIYRLKFNLPLARIAGVGIEQGFLGERLGYGTIIITGAGGTRDVFHRVADPEILRKKILENRKGGKS